MGRARGKRFIALAGQRRIVYDADTADADEPRPTHRRAI
jgi:FdhD protein